MSSIPTIDSLDFDWVGAQIGIPNSVSLTKSRFGNGQGSSCYRLTVSTSDGGSHSVIAKCPSHEELNRQTARAFHLYDKEVSFYRFLASDVPVRTPKCYFAQRDEDDNFLLLLEDLSPAADINQFTRISLEVAKEGLRALAGLHGATVMKSELHRSPWLHVESEEEKSRNLAMLSTVIDMFRDRLGQQVDDETLKTVTTLKESIQLYGGYSPPKPCVIHGDFRTDNLLIDALNGGVPLAVVDWQNVAVGCPMFDVAYFLVTSLTKDDCETYEGELIDFYLERLRDSGVNYPRELARHEYARYTLQPVVIALAGTVMARTSEWGNNLLRLMLEKGVAAVKRWDALGELKRCI